MAVLLFQAIGYAVGGPLGAAIGGAIGGMLLNKPQDQTYVEPRLTDGRIISVPYGEPLPYLDGTDRTAGVVIWMGPLITVEHVQTVEAGKGDGPTSTSITYTYRRHLYFFVADHACAGIRKIWHNGKCIYNIGDDADENTLRASHYSQHWARMTVYTGAADQQPDPTYEAHYGVGNVSAHRHCTSVFLESFDLGRTDQVGNFEFEVVRQGVISQVPIHIYTPSQIYIGMDTSGSMSGLRLANMKTAMGIVFNEMQAQLNAGTIHRVALIGWATNIYYGYFDVTSSSVIQQMRGFVDFLTAGGGTDANQAFYHAGLFFAATPNKNNVLITISDGAMSNVAAVLASSILKISDMLDTTTGSYSDTNGNSVYMRGIGIDTIGSLASFDNSGLAIPIITDANPEQLAAEILEAIKVKVDVIAPTPQPIADVVERLCERVNLPSDAYDVTGLAGVTKLVRGFTSISLSNMRAVLDQLRLSHNLLVHCRDKIYFTAGGTAPVCTIHYDDLGATFGDPVGNPFNPRQLTDIETPDSFNVTYKCASNGYHPDMRPSDRRGGVYGTVEPIELVIVMSPAEAQGVADTQARRREVGRMQIECSVLGKYDYLDGGDVLLLTDDVGRLHRYLLTSTAHDFPLLKFSAVRDDAEAWQETGITDDDFAVDDSIVPRSNSIGYLLDISLLRDADDGFGFYKAVGNDTDNWPWAASYQSINNTDFSQVAIFPSVATVGVTTTILCDYAGGNAFDTLNLVTVSLNRSASGSTRENILSSLYNSLWLIGDELVQPVNVDLVSGNTFVLSRMLRGRFGTEHAMASHAVGERVIKITTTGLADIDMSLGMVGQTLYYRTVTDGQSLGDVVSVPFANTAERAKPRSPMYARATRDGSGNLTIAAQRRTRLASTWITPNGGTYFPLGEAVEAYECDIYTDDTYATVVRTLSASTLEFVYSSANQTTDFGSNQAVVYARIYQLSDTVGRGHYLERDL